jgi:pilus assembly protein CpaB
LVAAGSLSSTRALKKPRRLDLRVVLGIILSLLAVLGSVAYWTLTSDARSVLIATRDLQMGATFQQEDLAVAGFRVDDAIYAKTIPAEELSSLVGRELAEPVHPQQLLVRAQVSNRPPFAPDQRAMTIAVSPETAVGGRIRPGDSVQVLVTTNKGTPEAKTEVVLPRVTVFDVGYDQQLTVVGSMGSSDASQPSLGGGSLKSVTLVVSEPEALALGRAKWNGELDVLLLSPQAQ